MVVIGEDDRVPVVNTSALPAAAIGRLVAKLPQGGFYGCTGTMVAANLVLTAGHCVLNDDGSLKSHEIRFFRAITSEPQSFESGVKVNFKWTNSNYGQGSSDENRLIDYALVRLESSNSEWLSVHADDLFEGAILSNVGYPMSKSPKGWVPYSEVGCKLTKLADIYPTAFWSSCDVSEGMSGGPVLAWDPSEGKYLLVGVNVAEGNPVNGSFHLRSSFIVRQLSEAGMGF